MRDVRPFFTPPVGLVKASAWERRTADEWEPLGERVEDWDYRTTLRLRCRVDADLSAVRAAARLPDGAVTWAVGWRATDTGLVGEPRTASAEVGAVALELDIPPDRAGATICLTRRLVLTDDRIHALPGQAQRAGSILWADDHIVRLTGQGAAFPAEVVDFRALGLESGASWHLQLPATPDVPVMGAMILLINSADSDLVAAVSAGRKPTEKQQLLLTGMEEGIVEELVRWALRRWPGLEDAEADSVGATARTLAARVLPDVESWVSPEVDSMALKAAIVAGCRRIGFGRRLP